MKKCIFLLIGLFPLIISAQQTHDHEDDTRSKEIAAWLENLSEQGLEIRSDSVIIGRELQKVLQDESYRNIIYPDSYTWEQATEFIRLSQLRQAFWFFINLYSDNETNKEIVVRSVLAYDNLFKMDEMMANVFYTYSFMDPEVTRIVDGKPEVVRPDILETKLRHVREIVDYIHAYRTMQIDEDNQE